MSGQSNFLSIAALMSGSSNTTMMKNDMQDNHSYAALNSNKEMEVLESLLQLQMSKDDKPTSSLNITTKRKSFQANEEQQLILQSLTPNTQVEPVPSTPAEPISKVEHIEDSLPRDKRLRQFQNTFFDSTFDNSRFSHYSSTQANTNGTNPVWPQANLSLPLPPKSRLTNYNNAHSKSLNDLQSMIRITKNVQRPPTPSSLVPKKCNSFEEIPGVNIVKTEKSFSNIQLPLELPPSPEQEPKKGSNKNSSKKPALPFEPTFLVRDKIPPNRRFFDEQWMQHFQELKEFHAKYGHTNVTRTADEYRGLGNWVAEQRRKLRKGRLSKEQFDLLNTIDFEWDRSYYFKATTEPSNGNAMVQSPPASPPVSRMVYEAPQTPVFSPPVSPVQSRYPKPLPPLPFQMTEIKQEPKSHRLENILNVAEEAPSSPMDFSYTFSYPTSQESGENKSASSQKILSILIAQEDVSNRIILVKLLEGMGYEDIDVAEGGVQMVDMVRNKQYDCIVLDLAISGVDAIEFSMRVRSEQNKHQPYIIGVSSKSSAVFMEERNCCIQAGINEIVTSPLNRDHLSSALQTCYAFKYGI